MCLNLYVPWNEIDEFREIMKKLDIVAVHRTAIDCFVTDGDVYRLHLKESFEQKKHEPEKLFKKLFTSTYEMKYPKIVLEQILQLENVFEYTKPIYKKVYKKKVIEKSEITWSLVTTHWAYIPESIKRKFEPNFSWGNDWEGCFLALTVFPGFRLTIDDYERENSENSMFEKYYTVIFNPGIPEYKEFQNLLYDKKLKWLDSNALEKSFNQYILYAYNFVAWRCSDTGAHSYFIINIPSVGMFISNFPAPHYVPLVTAEWNMFDKEIDTEFSDFVARQPKNLEGCLNVVNYILQEDEQHTITSKDILSVLKTAPANKYKQTEELFKILAKKGV